MSLDPHQQQMALPVAVQVVAELAVAHQLRDQLPVLTLCLPSQTVSRDWRQKEWSLVFISMQMFQKTKN